MTQRLRLPAEWEPHAACWLAFPYRQEQWFLGLREAQACVAALCCAIAGAGHEPVRLLVNNDEVEERARSLIGDRGNLQYVRARYGDCWLRDTGPLLGQSSDGTLGALCFRFNGWGNKYLIPFDEEVGPWLTQELNARRFECPWILEGGALESNGEGTLVTTASCTLNPNRNPGLNRSAFEESLRGLLRVERFVWLESGLAHDHTDGHIDMIARFVSPDRVACMRPDPAHPNARILGSIEQQLREAGFDLLSLPAPPAIYAPDGAPLPASYCNFYIANQAVIVPIYDCNEDARALEDLSTAFPGREVIGLPARDLLCGGGAFHCVTQAQPKAP